MNRADIRQAIYDQIDWQPDTSEQAEDKVNRFINRSYQQLALEAPFLFFEDKAHFRTQPSAVTNTTITNDGLTQSSSASVQSPGIVWERSYAISAGTPSGDDASIVEWDLDPTAYVTDGTPHPWDGRWLEITGSDGQVHRRRIRRIWYVETSNTHTDYITLDRPLDLLTNAVASTEYTKLDYRIFTQSYYLPADTIEVRSLRIYNEQRREPISLIYTEEAEEQWWDDIQGTSASGAPRKAFRTEFFQLPSPVMQPKTSVTSGTWSDDYKQPLGTFEFIYTICWGAKDPAHTTIGSKTFRLPRWESSPSPISEAKVVATTSEVISVETADVGALFGFTNDGGSELEHGKSGFWKRIYARRVGTTRSDTSTQAQVGDSSDFFFVGFSSGTETDFEFNGELLNANEPYRDTHGYSGIQLSPLPDSAYDVDIRYLRKPHPLTHDQAVPRLPPESVDVLVQKSLILIYESLGSHELSVMAQTRYQQSLVTLSKRYGSFPTGVFRKRLGRSRGYGRRGYRFLVEER